MTNAYKLYLEGNKYRVIDDEEFINIAKDKILDDNTLQKKYANGKINKLAAFKIFQYLEKRIQPVNAMLIEIRGQSNTYLKIIETMEEEIEKFIFSDKNNNEENVSISEYLNGSQEAMVNILEKELGYVAIEGNERTLAEFVEKEVFVPISIRYNGNDIKVKVSNEKFICNNEKQKVYKYQATIVDQNGYQFNFKKTELFRTKEEAIIGSQQLLDENYDLPLRNSQIANIMVKTDEDNTIIVFWPDIPTEKEYIMANDIIGKTDLAGETKTSMAFFNNCKDATEDQVILAQKVIENCMNLETKNLKTT